jgi:hypothetical protein
MTWGNSFNIWWQNDSRSVAQTFLSPTAGLMKTEMRLQWQNNEACIGGTVNRMEHIPQRHQLSYKPAIPITYLLATALYFIEKRWSVARQRRRKATIQQMFINNFPIKSKWGIMFFAVAVSMAARSNGIRSAMAKQQLRCKRETVFPRLAPR